ncbi:MAG: EAL domain-containing protein [Pseudomonadota bacterium]
MTLYRQLLVFTFLLFFLLFAGTWLTKLGTTRSFLQNQLESHAQDTATSLGLSLSPHIAAKDLPSAEAMINAVFDRGYYKIVRYTDNQGKVLIDRVMKVTIENVPEWFVRLVPLEAPRAEAQVMAGWLQAGTIYVESHPGYAYKTLWETVTRMTVWYAVTGILVGLAGFFGLSILLRPLRRVERQADALCRKEYEIQERLPRTKELRRVVEAMNNMTGKVKEMFEYQAMVTERFRQHAYHDPLTGLGNRRYFAGQVERQLEEEGEIHHGAILLAQIHDLQKLNQEKGLQAGDDLLKECGRIIQEETKDITGSALARLTGGDFAVFLPEGASLAAERLVSSLLQRLSGLATKGLTLSDNVAHAGVATYDRHTTFAELLAEADLALRSAQQEGPNAWKILAVSKKGGGELPQGRQQWKDALEKAIRERQVALYVQAAVKSTDRNQVVHQEIFSRIKQENGEILSAGLFMPFAEHLELVSALDRIVIEKALAFSPSVWGSDTIAVNMSPASLHNDSFHKWIMGTLAALPKEGPRIIFEFSEFAAIQHLEQVKGFSTEVRKLGHSIGLDHFGQSFSNFGYLQSLRPEHVKIDRAYTRELRNRESDSCFFIGSLCNIAHTLDIRVIAKGVESQEQWTILQELNLDAMQGYYIDRPTPLHEKGAA